MPMCTNKRSLRTHKVQMLAMLLLLPAIGLTAEPPEQDFVMENVGLPAEERDALVAAPHSFLHKLRPLELREAIHLGTIDSIRVDKITEKPSDEDVERLGRDPLITYQGWIRYSTVVLSTSRLYHPIVLCVSQGVEINWVHCQDHSKIQLQTKRMQKPITFHGDLSDEQVDQIFDAIDDAKIISTKINEPWTSDNIYRIRGGPHHTDRGICVTVLVRYSRSLADSINLEPASDGQGFEIAEYNCGIPGPT